MENKAVIQREVTHIALAIADDVVTASQLDRLSTLVEQHPAAARRLAELLQLCGSLQDAVRNLRPDLVDSQTQLPPSATALKAAHSVSKGRTRAGGRSLDGNRHRAQATRNGARNEAPVWRLVGFSQTTVALASAVATALVLWFTRTPYQLDNSEPTRVTAQVVSMSQCVWDGGKLAEDMLGESVPAGRSLSLQEGILEFDLSYRSGATAVARVCGPAILSFRHDGVPKLLHGRMTISTGYTTPDTHLQTPSGLLSFGSQASLGVIAEAETTAVHVFNGIAHVDRGSARTLDGLADEVLVHSGESKRFHGALLDEWEGVGADADPSLFAFRRSLSAEKLNITDAYRRAVRALKPSLYWQFEEHANSGVANAGVQEDLVGLLRGDARLSPQRGGNQAVEFGLTPFRASIVSEGLWPQQPLDSYTIEFWMKPSHFHTSAVFGLVDPTTVNSHLRQSHGCFFGLVGPRGEYDEPVKRHDSNTMRFVHRMPVAFNGGVESSPQRRYSVREWQHVVLRKTERTMSVFINGKCHAITENDRRLPKGLQVVIGQLYSTTGCKAARSYSGQVDEVALYDYALSEDDIDVHYRLAAHPGGGVSGI